jgi:WD40 repeat protein
MKSTKNILIMSAALCCIFAEFYADADNKNPSNISLTTKEISLVKFDQGKSIRADATVSPDNRRIAYLEFEGISNGRIVVNGVSGKHDSFSGSGVTFSPDGKHLVYGGYSKDGKRFTVLDNVEISNGGSPIFSSDGKQIAYHIWDNNSKKEVIFFKGEKVGEFDRIIGANQNKYPIFSLDGRRLGLIAGNGKKNFVVVDGKEGKYYDYVGGLMFSQDSQHYMYFATDNKRGIIVKNDIEIAESNDLESAVFSPDLSRIACIYKEGDKKYVVVDGKQGKQYDNITELKFSPNGKRFAYAAWSGGIQTIGTMFAVIDGKEQKNYRWVMDITFSPDGERVAYSAGIKEEVWEHCIVVDGIEGKKYQIKVPDPNFGMSPPIFSPDSKHFGYAVEMGNESWMVVDEIEGKHYDKIRKETMGGWDKWDKSFTFGPDGKIAYWAAKKGYGWMVVVDGIESKAYWEYLPDGKILFEGPNLFSFVAFRDYEIFRVEIEIKQN